MRAKSSKQRCPVLCLYDLSYNVKYHWSCRVGGCYSHLTASESRQGFPGVDHEGHQACVVKKIDEEHLNLSRRRNFKITSRKAFHYFRRPSRS